MPKKKKKKAHREEEEEEEVGAAETNCVGMSPSEE